MSEGTITCGICGYTYTKETTGYHDKMHGNWSVSELPYFIANAILYWTDQILRKADPESEDQVHVEEVDKALWTTMHIWFNKENMTVKAQGAIILFEGYRNELNNRYPNLREWKSKYAGPWEL